MILLRTLNTATRNSLLTRTKASFFLRRFNEVTFEHIPEVSRALIKKTLKLYNVSFEDGYTCFKVHCPMCSKTTKPSVQNIYINKTTGMFMCSYCMRTGQWDFLEKFLKPKKGKAKKELDEASVCTSNREQLSEALKSIQDETVGLSTNFSSMLQKFKLPVVEGDAFKNLDIRIDQVEQNLYFPLENVESEIVGYRRLSSKSGVDITVPNVMYGGLLTGKAPKNKDSALLVPSIADFLVLVNHRVNLNVICLPNGVNNLPQSVLPNFEKYKQLILWFDNDIKSRDSARNFAKKLGEKRCLFIRPSEKKCAPHLLQDTDFKSIISSAQPIWHKSITTFASLRQDILSDLQNVDKVEGVKWKRFPTLNKILKGHRRGELTVVTGPTGCGKTTFISEYSLDLAMQGVNTLWGSFEIRNARLARTMLQQFSCVPLEENLDKFESFADNFEKLPIYFMTFHGQQTIKVVMEAVEHAAYVHDIEHVIIDNLQFMMGITEEHKHMDRYWKQDSIISYFRTFATRKNCHVTLVIHPRKERDDEDLTTSSIFGGAKASQEADNVLIIQDKRLTSIRGKKYIQVCKNRYTGDLGVVPLDFDKKILSFAQKKRKLDDKAKKECVPLLPQE